jgi:hypothetical protein
MDRVMAIGLAHNQLSFKKSASSVDMRDYLKALCANIDPHRPNLTIDTEFESIRPHSAVLLLMADRTGWLPFLNTYRTMCREPVPAFRQVLEKVRALRFAA